jgi:prepilin-type N-terminal cleavage/methylation domain-containing protein
VLVNFLKPKPKQKFNPVNPRPKTLRRIIPKGFIGDCPLSPQSGFTLVEALISILIFGLTLTAVFYVLVVNLGAAQSVKNNFIASGLVQEGMETVRNIRDNDWLAGSSFGTGIPDGNYRVQWNSQSLMAFADSYLKKDSGTGFFSYDSGSDTIFKRAVTINAVSGIEKQVVITVTWNERGRSKSVSAEDHLYNWK